MAENNENPDEVEIDPDSRLATRAERLARREAQPWRKTLDVLRDLLPLAVLTITMIGALKTFYNQEVGRTFAVDAGIASCFVVVLLIVGYLNPQVQHYVQTRGRYRE